MKTRVCLKYFVNNCSLKSDVDKLETASVDLSNLGNVVKSDIVKKSIYDELVKKVNAIQTISKMRKE